MIAYVIAIVLAILSMGNSRDVTSVVVIPPMPNHAPSIPVTAHDYAEDGVFDYCLCDECCHAVAYAEYADEFTALFNAMEFKVSKNGRSMVRRPGEKSFRFVKKG